MLKNKKFSIIIAGVLVIIGLLAGLFMAMQRMQIESNVHQAEIVMDWAQITERARQDGVEPKEILDTFAPHITGVLIKEPTVYALAEEGRVVILNGDELKWQTLGGGLDIGEVKTDLRYMIFFNEEDALRTLAAVHNRQKAAYAELFPANGVYVLATSLTKTELTSVGIGFEKAVLDMIAAENLGIAVQIGKIENYTADAISSAVKILQGYRIIAVGFNDTSVPGVDQDAETWKVCKQAWIEALASVNAPLMTVEFYTQKGVESLAQAMSPNIARLHSMSEAEMKKDALIEAAPQRYQLATSERNIKIAFVRIPVLEQTPKVVDFVASVRSAIEAKGTVVGPLNTPENLTVPAVLILLMVAAVCAGGYLLGLRFIPAKWAFILAALAFFGGVGLLVIGRAALVQKLFALCSALIFPTLSIITFLPERGLPLGKAILQIIYTCLFSLIGAVLIVGLLADNLFMFKIDGFVGVKVAHMIPVVIVLGYYFFLRDKGKKPAVKLYSCLNYRITVGFAALAVMVMAVLAIYVSRTGNETAAVSGFEKWMRTFLDQTLYVRPRTKEFLLGYPCLLFMYYYGYRDIYLPVLALATIGQVSLVNTYAHIHTPIVYSLLRSFNGFWLGMVIAIVAVLLFGVALKWGKKYWENFTENIEKMQQNAE